MAAQTYRQLCGYMEGLRSICMHTQSAHLHFFARKCLPQACLTGSNSCTILLAEGPLATLGATTLSLIFFHCADELAMPTELQCLIAEMNWDV